MKKKLKKLGLEQSMILLLTVLLLLCTLLPFYLMLISSFKYKMQILENIWAPALPVHLDNYMGAFKQVAPYMLNSIIVTVGVVAGVLLVSTLAGYAFYRFKDMPGKNLLFFLILSFMMVPAFLVLLPQFMVATKLKMLNTYVVQILPPIGALAPMATFLAKTYFEGIPYSLFETASMEGAGEWKIYTKVALPMAGPLVATITILDSVIAWNNYIWPLIAASAPEVKPLIIALQGILSNPQNEQGIQLAGYVIASLPLLIFFCSATKQFVTGISAGAIKA